jgi:hypothetical protein
MRPPYERWCGMPSDRRFIELVDADFARARDLFIEAVLRAEGNLSDAARLLGTTYVTMTRLARRMGAWGEVERIRRAAARRRMVVPEPERPVHSGHRGVVREHRLTADDVIRSGGRVR